ncbi:MAG: hypothetical protein K2N29_02900, partial [Ruminiclostridium sp.]|nr:hypothetical protein [Ruminiclostridium sp.]
QPRNLNQPLSAGFVKCKHTVFPFCKAQPLTTAALYGVIRFRPLGSAVIQINLSFLFFGRSAAWRTPLNYYFITFSAILQPVFEK